MRKQPKFRRDMLSADHLTAAHTILLSACLIGLLAAVVAAWILLILITVAVHPILTVIVVGLPFSVLSWYGLPKRRRGIRSPRRTIRTVRGRDRYEA